MLTLEDILNLPNNPTDEHKAALNLIPKPAPTPSIIPANANIPASPVTPRPVVDWKAKIGATNPNAYKPSVPEMAPVDPGAAGTPNFGTGIPEDTSGVQAAATGKIPELPKLGFKERQALPLSSEGVAPGSPEYFRAQAARLEDQRNNPWGSAENHPGLLGKIGHVAAKIGNIAGDIVAPATMANIPGTELNKKEQLNEAEGKAVGAEHAELEAKSEATKERQEDTRELHEENIHDTNEEKIKQVQQKIDEMEKKHLSDREIALRKQGLKPDPKDENGTIPITLDEMTESEKDVHNLKAAQAESQAAKALLDKVKADPNSPQSQAALQRVRIMAQNASTAAKKLGLDEKKFVADYFGLDPNGDPLPGVEKTPEGKAIGPRIAHTSDKAKSEFNRNYEKPSNDTERAYQLYQEAMKAYNSGDTQTGAATMLALSQHIGTTFGQIKGSRMNKDLINEHKDAIGITDRLERFAASLSRGDQLSASQMKEFGDQIHAFRNLSWQTAVKEAKRANLPVDFLPRDLAGGGGAGGGKTYTDKDVQDAVAAHPGTTAQQIEDAFKKKGWNKNK